MYICVMHKYIIAYICLYSVPCTYMYIGALAFTFVCMHVCTYMYITRYVHKYVCMCIPYVPCLDRSLRNC